MKEIKLTQGQFALVDDSDYEYLNQYKWCANKYDTTYYAVRVVGKQTIYLHRVIMNTPDNLVVNHWDYNGLNCQKHNMINCTQKENAQYMRIKKTGTSKYIGVSWFKRDKKWTARIRINNKSKNLGYFNSEIEAANQRDKMALMHYGRFVTLNFKQNAEL
jgi:hypothetical protein